MNNLIAQPTKADMREVLQNLGHGMHELTKAYEQTMERINDQGTVRRTLAHRILGWIVHTKRPLSTVELRHALAVRQGTAKLNEDYLPTTQIIQSVCAGLVTVDEQSGIIRLVHFTVQEYFTETWTKWFPDAHANIADVCVAYLSFDVFDTGFCDTDDAFERRLQANPLYDYAARYWGYHASEEPIQNDGILMLLESRTKVSAATQAMMAFEPSGRYSQDVPRQMTAVHVAAYFGLERVMAGLLTKDIWDYGVDLKDTDGRTPLSRAAENGYEAVVKLLLDTGNVDINSKDNRGRTPLLWAAQNGHEAVVKLLLDTGNVNINSKDNLGRTPLLWAAANRYETVVKLLLNTSNVDVDSTDRRGETPLLCAAEKGHEAVVKLLLNTSNVDVNSKDNHGQTSLSLAAMNGQEAVVKLLLGTGNVEFDSRDNGGRTPLLWASRNRHKVIVELLLNTGNVNVDSVDNRGRTPLLWAAQNGHEAVVKLLLDTGIVDINSKSNYGQTPLLCATENGHETVIKLLLDTGNANINLADFNGQTPLSLAAQNGHEAVVELLQSHGAVS
jgi:ankyrin repeat protein